MCTISAICDYGRNKIDPELWNPELLAQFKKLLESAKQFDEVAKQPDCVDPEKIQWVEALEQKVNDDNK